MLFMLDHFCPCHSPQRTIQGHFLGVTTGIRETGLPCCVFGALYKLEPIFSLSSETKLKSMNCILQECELRVHRTITILRTHDVRFFRVLLFAFSILNFNNCPIFSVKIMVHSMTLIYSTINLVSWHCYLLLP